MRNAAAAFDDFGNPGATRKGAGRSRTAARGGKKKAPRRSPFDLQGVARYAAIGMAATMALGIIVNALLLQKGHHPAPLFAKTAAASPAPVVAPRVAGAPVKAAAVEEAPASPEVAPTKSHRATGNAHAEGGDAIGRLLAGETLSQARGQPAAGKGPEGRKNDAKATSAKTADARTVSGVQRALTKLGFVVPATGTAGPATRKAIEAFQKDRHLPVKGELDRRVVKLLAAESGVKID